MIDHVSVPVRDLHRSALFYERILGPLGLSKLVTRAATVGFGKLYPEFWINLRPDHSVAPGDPGAHVCLRAGSEAAVRSFFETALLLGGGNAGEPGPREGTVTTYFGAFILDPDGNKIEAVTFPRAEQGR